MTKEAIGAIGSSNIGKTESDYSGAAVAYDKDAWLKKNLQEGNVWGFAAQHPNALS